MEGAPVQAGSFAAVAGGGLSAAVLQAGGVELQERDCKKCNALLRGGRWSDPPPKCPRRKGGEKGKKKQSEKHENTDERRKNVKTTKVSEERTQKPSTGKEEGVQKRKENEGEKIATGSERDRQRQKCQWQRLVRREGKT
uniref:Uncharacterized protein n=1 Tax=Octopus bimaculoides TaxID=37653 RepID=A0A0L8G046_OCTBM